MRSRFATAPSRRLPSNSPCRGIAAAGASRSARRSRPAMLDDFRLNNLGKYCCYAIVAVGIGIAWGRGGMLVLGQGLFFGLGAYVDGDAPQARGGRAGRRP